jgi:hypothetical protein
MLMRHIDHLIARLHDTGGKPTNAVRWIHHAIYDIIVYLVFGHVENSLACDDWHPPVRLVFRGIREAVCTIEILRFIPFKHFALNVLLRCFAGAQVRKFNVAVERARLRMELTNVDNPDFS